MKDRFKKLYMDIAKRTAQESYAVKLKVGCVIVKDEKIISFGYNGTPSGFDNTCEDKIHMIDAGGWLSPEEIYEQYPYVDNDGHRYALKTKPEVLHSEANALMKLAKTSESGLGADIFITHSPCIDCSKLVYQAGIKQVFYCDEYRSSDGIQFLEKCGITVEQLLD
jgi:dCMP deaminase